MTGKFEWKKFADVDLNDVFFESLKSDYEKFPVWFKEKQSSGKTAMVFNDDKGIGAFVYLKKENETIELAHDTLPAIPRLKIGTLMLAERFRGMRFGEGALGVALWYWQKLQYDEIYITVFEKHTEIINLFERFGFVCIGINKEKERVYIKNRADINYSDPYKSFPFINSKFDKAGLIPINDYFHDKLFPYSELKGVNGEIETETAGNGITKVFIATPSSNMHYSINEPVFIYRIHTGDGSKTYKSAVTSFCTITRIKTIKDNGKSIMSLPDFIKCAGNKTIFTVDELTAKYSEKNVVMIELVYNGFFGKGHNVIHKTLQEKGMFGSHPYNLDFTNDQFTKILEMGGINVQNVIID